MKEYYKEITILLNEMGISEKNTVMGLMSMLKSKEQANKMIVYLKENKQATRTEIITKAEQINEIR